MVVPRVAVVFALVGIGACHTAQTRPPNTTDQDASVATDAGPEPDAPATPDLAIERPPAAVEICGNGLDDDGNGLVDEGCVCAQGATQACYPGPRRLSGVGTCAAGTQACLGDAEFGHWGPCEHAVTPVPETCDGLDNNCNGVVDDSCLCAPGATRPCYGGPPATAHVGTCRDGTQTCRIGVGGVGSFWDACDGEIRPDRDVCDGFDNDCNGTVDDGCACLPDDNRTCYGGAPGTQGVGPCAAGRQACVTNGTSSAWGACTGQTVPAPELCDGIDNDCDGVVDDGCVCKPGATRACYLGPASTRGVGVCADGVQTCVTGPGGVGSDWGSCTGGHLPDAETCNDLDDDCDGVIDDGCVCRRGDTRVCYDGPSATAGVGICRAGTQACIIEAGVARFGPCTGQVLPAAGGETCNGTDDDCDGVVDGMTRSCGSNVGDCRPGTETCTAGAWGACVGAVGPKPEDCNGGDENCDGMVDEGCECLDGSTRACGHALVGICKPGTQTCVNGHWAACGGGTDPGTEICNSLDDDCDGVIDNGCVCVAGDTRPCYSGPPGTAGVAGCRSGTQMCLVSGGVAGWGACAGEVLPSPEICNGVDDDCNGMTDDGLSTPIQVITPRAPNRDADILFMIDDSSSMNTVQANLVANFPILMSTLRAFPGGLPNLHIAVVTSDLGAGPEVSYAGCTPGGDGGNFHAAAAGCAGPTGTFIDESNNEATKNYPGAIEDAFTCIANVGTVGCGFEHQLASAAVALGFRGSIPAANAGFLRPDAFLAIAFITNEDDCSAPPDTMLFTTTSFAQSSTYGPPIFRCNEFGHLCGGVAPPRNGTTSVPITADCHSNEMGLLYPVGGFATFFKSLKADPSMVFVASIAAPVKPYIIDYRPSPYVTGENAASIEHSCMRSDGGNGDPAVRMTDFVTQFGANGSASSICDNSFAPALTQLGTAIGRAFTSNCLDATVPDSDATAPGIQASCDVVLHAPGMTDRTIPTCDMATPQGGPQPCWYLTASAACTSGVLFAMNRTGATAAGETISVRCGSCR